MKYVREVLLAWMLMLSIVSCSAWDMLKPSSGLAVETELVVGDKNQTVNTELGQTNNRADNITQNIDSVDYVTLGLLILSVITGVIGWMLPVPKFMRKG